MLKSLQNVPNPRTFFRNKGEEAKGAQYYLEKYDKDLTQDDNPFLFDSEEEAKNLKKTILDGIPNTDELQKTRNFVDKLIGINKKQYKAPEETEAVDKYVVYGKKTKVLYNHDNWISNLFDAMKDSFNNFEKPSKYNFESWKTNINAFKKVIPKGVDIGQITKLDKLITDNEKKVTSSGGTRRRKRGGRKSKAKKSSKNKTNKKRKRKGSKKSRK